MKLLLDTCVAAAAKNVLTEAGYDVIWVGEWDGDPGDEAILTFAHGEDRILVTLDKDFGELAVVHGRPHSGIIRLVGFPSREQGAVTLRTVNLYGTDLNAGGIVTVSPKQVRIRPGESDDSGDGN